MNWSIWEKIYTYFYNKFRPMNRTHYMKWGVNISSNNSGCCRRSVVPQIAVLSRDTEFTKRVIYKFTFLWFSPIQGTTNRPTSHLAHLYIHCALSLAARRTQTARTWVDDFVVQCLLWRLSIRKTSFAPALGVHARYQIFVLILYIIFCFTMVGFFFKFKLINELHNSSRTSEFQSNAL